MPRTSLSEKILSARPIACWLIPLGLVGLLLHGTFKQDGTFSLWVAEPDFVRDVLGPATAYCSAAHLLQDGSVGSVPWSVSAGMASGAQLPCSSVAGALAALAGGRREAAAGQPPSYFVPAGCSLPWQAPAAVCSTVARFSSITLIGDSLTRHTLEALLALMAGDLVHGGKPYARSSLPAYNPAVCVCDAQYSVAEHCRPFNARLDMPSMHADGLCPGTAQDTALVYCMSKACPPLELHERLCAQQPGASAAARQHVVLFSGGVHYDCDPQRFWGLFLLPHLHSLAHAQRCRQQGQGPVLWAFTGLNQQAPSYDKVFPHQAPAPSLAFNEEIESRLREALAPGSELGAALGSGFLGVLDFFPLTEQQRGNSSQPAMSDGYHYAAEVNLVKANSLVQVLRLALQKGGE